MSNPAHVDGDIRHLWPPFAAKVAILLERMRARTGVEWVIVEGHRSDERQAHLWTIGRRGIPGERPVTWIRSTPWHGAGLAADLAPKSGYSCPREWWDWLFEEETKLGLIDPPRKKGDLGHVQFACDEATREKAKAWTLAGFPDTTDSQPTAVILGKAQIVAPVNRADHWLVEAGGALNSLGVATEVIGGVLFFRAADLRGLGFTVEGDASGVRVTKG